TFERSTGRFGPAGLKNAENSVSPFRGKIHPITKRWFFLGFLLRILFREPEVELSELIVGQMLGNHHSLEVAHPRSRRRQLTTELSVRLDGRPHHRPTAIF